MAETEHEPRSYETEVTLSTGTKLNIRESADEVVERFTTACTKGPSALLALTTGEGHLIHLVVAHVVAIAPRPPEAPPPSLEAVEGLTRPPVS